jgi:hypothetical protein
MAPGKVVVLCHRLHAHCHDPSLDDPIPQEYALFLCPTGSLLEKLQEFWRESRRQCAKNRAHEVFPHVTLCDFFTVSQHNGLGHFSSWQLMSVFSVNEAMITHSDLFVFDVPELKP